jgi:hypothetical protein
LHDETRTAATLAVIVGCFGPSDIMQWLQEFKPMTKEIAVSYHSATGCECHREFDLKFNNLSHLQLDRQDREYARFTNVKSPTRHEPILRADCHLAFPIEPPLTPVLPSVVWLDFMTIHNPCSLMTSWRNNRE